MKISLDNIKEPIHSELSEFKLFFGDILQTQNNLLNIVLKYIVKNKGKELRPVLVFLSAKLVGEVSHRTYIAASMVELMHTATLIHDDVVDNSQLRRSNFSVKALWKSKLAVLVGDFMLAQGLKLSVQNKAYDVLEVVSVAVQEMAEGELIQIEKARKLNITEEVYFEIIKKKTASLLIASAKSGILSVDATDVQIASIEKFAYNLGIAFQIKDDLFDYDRTNIIGKPKANDIQESKLTLPLIFSLNSVSPKDRRKILKILGFKVKTENQIEQVQNFVHKNGGIEYSKKVLQTFSDIAINILIDNFDDTDARDALIKLVKFVINRPK